MLDDTMVRGWLTSLPGVYPDALERLERFAALLTDESMRQNLVAASTLGAALWVRHIADSAQLLRFAPAQGGRWVDLGSGAGLPGVIVAILAPQWHVTLVEPRRLRCDFLQRCADELHLDGRLAIAQQRAEQHDGGPYDVVSARAFAPLAQLVPVARHLVHKSTTWLLPKGKNAVNELSTLPKAWQKLFHVEPSLTDPQGKILVAKSDFPSSA